MFFLAFALSSSHERRHSGGSAANTVFVFIRSGSHQSMSFAPFAWAKSATLARLPSGCTEGLAVQVPISSCHSPHDFGFSLFLPFHPASAQNASKGSSSFLVHLMKSVIISSVHMPP